MKITNSTVPFIRTSIFQSAQLKDSSKATRWGLFKSAVRSLSIKCVHLTCFQPFYMSTLTLPHVQRSSSDSLSARFVRNIQRVSFILTSYRPRQEQQNCYVVFFRNIIFISVFCPP
jgi:hypothetical protein